MKVSFVLLLFLSLNALALNEIGIEKARHGAALPRSITPEIVRILSKSLTNICEASENPSIDLHATLGGVNPGSAVIARLKYKFDIDATGEVETVITQQPSHGSLKIIEKFKPFYFAEPTDLYEYTPSPGFFGEDKVAFEVTLKAHKFHVSYVIKVVHGGFNDACVP